MTQIAAEDAILDFEPDSEGLLPDGTLAADNVPINDQFLASHGISFGIDNNLDGIADAEGNYRLETHYDVNIENFGQDNGTTAFWNNYNRFGRKYMRDLERPEFEGRLGDYMLTNEELGDTLLISYETMVAAASGEVWDLDRKRSGDYEQILLEALDENGNTVDTILSPPGGVANSRNPYEGGPWIWSFDLEDDVIAHVRMRSVGTGEKLNAQLAFDNFRYNSAFTSIQPALEEAGVTDIDSTVDYPNAADHYTVCFEDNFPDQGDFDFNDLVFSYQLTAHLNSSGDLVMLTGIVYLHARRAGFVHDLDFVLPTEDASLSGSAQVLVLPNGDEDTIERNERFTDGTIVIPVIRDSRTYFNDVDNEFNHVNVQANGAQIDGPAISFQVVFDNLPDISDVPVGSLMPTVYVRDTEQSIDLSSRDAVGRPYALVVPTDWQHPTEETDIGIAYPRIVDYITSGGTTDQDWYLHPAANRTYVPERRWHWLPDDNEED